MAETAPLDLGLTGVDHVSLNVSDLGPTTAFYTDVIGLRLIEERPNLPVDGSWLECPDGRQVHLVVMEGHEAPKGQHFAFGVSDLDVTVDALQAAGVKTGKIIDIPNGARQTFCKDPSGNLVEFNQAPPA